jgi:undecaprenyl-diphosphatase
MLTIRNSELLRRVVQAELGFCVYVNASCQSTGVKRLFASISRIGDGLIWYLLIASLPLVFGSQGLAVSGQLLITGALSLFAYKSIKYTTGRSRPCNTKSDILLGAEPLDQYSFPSGHTLHALSFSIVTMYHYPLFGWVLVPIALLIAASRVILGLHYPTDVIAGALIGTAIASGCLMWLN